METNRILKAALYTRVSSEEQAQHGSSMETQLDALRKNAKANGYKIVQEYSDPGFTGASLDRPGLSKLRQDAKAKKFDVVLVYKTDRFSRSLPQVVRLVLEEFQQLDIGFKSITEPYDTTQPSGRILFANLAAFADFEREQIRERHVRGKRSLAAKGKVMQRWQPYGYAKDPITKDWVVNKEEAKNYHLMVNLSLKKNLSCLQIARKLTSLGIPTKRQKHIAWTKGAVKKILKHFVYKGQGYYANVTFPIPPLISEKDWNLVQEGFKKRRLAPKSKVKHEFLLRGLMICKCGMRFYCEPSSPPPSKKTRACYRCYSQKAAHGKSCGTPNMRREPVENWVWTRILRVIAHPSSVKQMIEGRKATGMVEEVTLDVQLSTLDKNIEKKKLQIQRTLNLYANEEIGNLEELQTVVRQQKEELDMLKKSREELCNQIAHQENLKSNISEVERFLGTFRQKVASLNFDQKREIILKLVERIEVSYNKGREVNGRHGINVIFKFQTPEFNFSPNKPIPVCI